MMRKAFVLLFCLLTLGGWRSGGSNSALGVDLALGYQPMPFLNILKTAGGWYTIGARGSNDDTHEEATLYSTFLNSNHYPTSITTGGRCPGGPCPSHTFTHIAAFPNPGATPGTSIPSGTYVLLFTGTQSYTNLGTFVFQQGGSFQGGLCTSPRTGRCLIKVDGTQQIEMDITATDPTRIGNYINNISLVYSPDSTSGHVGVNEAAYIANNCATATGAYPVGCYNPLWLAQVEPFKTFRMMDWSSTPNNTNTSWAKRSLPTWAFWNENGIGETTTGYIAGYPLEAQIGACLANSNNICWLNLPCLSNNSYVTSEATLVASIAGSSMKIIPEFCNEWWAQSFSGVISSALAAQGKIDYPLAGSQTDPQCQGGPFRSGYSYAFAESILRSIRTDNIFASIMGSQVIKEITWQIGNGDGSYIFNWKATDCGGSASGFSGSVASNVNAGATAPYISGGMSTPVAWTANADGGLANLFQEINSGGVLPQAVVTGNCGNGAGHTCGGTTAYTITTGLSLPSTPANGTCIGVTFNSTIGASATLAADGGTAYPIADPAGTALGAGAIQSGNTKGLCFTNATSSGATTAKWYELAGGGDRGFGYPGGFMAQTISWFTNDNALAASMGIDLYGYESGQQFYCFPWNNVFRPCTGLYYAANRDARMGTVYTKLYTALRALSKVKTINHFQDGGSYSPYGEWPLLENITQTHSAKYDAAAAIH